MPPPATAPDAPAARFAVIDWLKAIGIVLVVYEHFHGVPQALRDWIFSFHMPLFFVVAGALLKEAHLSGPWRAEAARAARQLLLPYAIFGAVGYAFWFLVASRVGTNADEQVAPLQPVIAWLWGSAKDMHRQPLEPSPLWFLPCLFSARLVFAALARLPRAAYLAALPLAAAVGMVALRRADFLPPFGLDSALAALPFMAVGRFWCRQGLAGPIRPSWLAAAALVAIGFLLHRIQGRVDIRAGTIAYPTLFYASALASLAGIASAFQSRPAPTVVERLSRDSLILFALHPMTYTLLTGVLVIGCRMPLEWRAWPPVSIAITVACLSILYFAAPIVRRLPGLRPRSDRPLTAAHAPVSV